MKKIKFLGASGEVTGSSYHVTADDGTELLVDFGMFQGPEDIEVLNYHDLGFHPANLKGVVLTHAHLDHCGRLPLLVYGGYFGKIYMTAPSAALVEIILRDSAQIAERDLENRPLYTMEQVEKVLQMIEVVEYHTPFSIGAFSVSFIDAGHILGSASLKIQDTSSPTKQEIVFSGDLGNTPEDIVKPTEYPESADIVVMETTYGDKDHPQEDKVKIIQEELNTIDDTGGVLLIPAFSIERTQEILHIIHHLKKEGKVRADTPVFLDSPMAIRVTDVYRTHLSYSNEEILSHTDDPFNFPDLIVTLEPKDSKEIIKAMHPKVIIAGSGMMNGGRILHHAFNYLSDPLTRVLFVGYQAEETIGRKILQGVKGVMINKKSVRIRAHIREIASMSSHADQTKLLTWLAHIKGVKKVFLTHGDGEQRKLFAEKVTAQLHLPDVILPLNNDEHAL